jgi:hypothetical protein
MGVVTEGVDGVGIITEDPDSGVGTTPEGDLEVVIPDQEVSEVDIPDIMADSVGVVIQEADLEGGNLLLALLPQLVMEEDSDLEVHPQQVHPLHQAPPVVAYSVGALLLPLLLQLPLAKRGQKLSLGVT